MGITGIFLALHYTSDLNSAHFSLFFLIREVYYGWCLRLFHSSGASFVFLFLFLHLGRAMFYASYFYNPNTWFSGILLGIFLFSEITFLWTVYQILFSFNWIYFFLLFFLFLASEALLFISFFWGSFHSLSSPSLGICPGEGFYVPDPCELTFGNTLLLSNAAVSLGGAFVSLEISSSFFFFFSLFSFILAWTFISLQIKEFRIMGLSINDSLYSSVFFFLTGLHFFHLLVGLLLLGLFFWGCSFG